MSVVTSVAVISQRMWRPHIAVDEYEQQTYLSDYLPKEIFEERIASIRHLIRKQCPSSYMENLILALSVVVIVVICVVSMLIRSIAKTPLESSLPFFLMFVPIIMILWGTRRRATFQYRVRSFEESLTKLLKELTDVDVTKDIKWVHRRTQPSDTWEALRISYGTGKPSKVTLLIQALYIDSNAEMTNMGEELLPAYNESNPQTAIDMDQTHLPDYDEATHDAIDMTDLSVPPSQRSSTPPSTALPQYENDDRQSR